MSSSADIRYIIFLGSQDLGVALAVATPAGPQVSTPPKRQSNIRSAAAQAKPLKVFAQVAMPHEMTGTVGTSGTTLAWGHDPKKRGQGMLHSEAGNRCPTPSEMSVERRERKGTGASDEGGGRGAKENGRDDERGR